MVALDGYYKPATLASAFGVSLDALRAANPALLPGIWDGQRLIPKGYALRVPRNPLRASPEVVLASIPAGERHGQQLRQAEYRVRRGDTLSRIAARFGVRTKDLMAANGLRSANRIYVGQKLEIPGSNVRVASTRSSGPTAAADGIYRVRSGDTLGRIAQRHGVSESALAKHNDIRNPSLVRVGETLRIPGRSNGSSASGGVYIVQRGDTLDSIARRHGTTAKSIAALNGLRSRNHIKAGQRLVLPGS